MAKTPFELRNEVLAQRVVKKICSAVLLMPATAQRRKKHWQRL